MRYALIGLALLAGGLQPAHADAPAVQAQLAAYLNAHHYTAIDLDQVHALNWSYVDLGPSHGAAEKKRVAPAVANRQTVTASINGQKVVLLVDTGCPRTVISDACARRLRLDVHDFDLSISGAKGPSILHMRIASIQSFTLSIGEINRPNTIMVLPKDQDLANTSDGLFGLDLLGLNRAIFPLGGKRLILKPGLTPVADVSEFLTKLGFVAVPLTVEGGHLFVTGHVNQTPMRFVIDSGATFSNFSLPAVQAAVGGKVRPLAGMMSWGLDQHAYRSYAFLPDRMDIGGIAVPPQFLGASDSPIFEEGHFSALLAEDLLGKRSGIVDLSGMRLWLRPAN